MFWSVCAKGKSLNFTFAMRAINYLFYHINLIDLLVSYSSTTVETVVISFVTSALKVELLFQLKSMLTKFEFVTNAWYA